METAATVCIILGLGLTLIGSVIAARGGMLTKAQIDKRVDDLGRWQDEAPPWAREDFETTSKSLRIGLWFIAARTALQIVGTAVPLLLG